jgi:hypothetical protein
MSGSPIVADDGSAIGLISPSSDDRSRYAYCTGPRLSGNLPGWLLRELNEVSVILVVDMVKFPSVH